MKSFLIRITAITILLALAGGILFTFFFEDSYTPVLLFLLIFFYLFTIISHAYQSSRIKSNFASFMRIHMIFTILRLFVYSAVIIVYLIFNQEKVISFVGVVVVLYIIYTFLETREMTRQTGRHAKKEP
jgi:hypothetical protein